MNGLAGWMVDGPSSPLDSGVDPGAVASVAGSIGIANEVVVCGAVGDVVGVTVVDAVLVGDVVGVTAVDVVLVVDVVGVTAVDVDVDVDVVAVAAVVAGSTSGSGTVDPHANPMDASTATAVDVISTRTLKTLLLRLCGGGLYGGLTL